MGIVLSVFDLCKKDKKDDKTKTTPSNKLTKRIKQIYHKKKHSNTRVCDVDIYSKEQINADICAESLLEVPPSTVVCAFNNDEYFSEEDTIYYKEKFANEKITQNTLVKIKYSFIGYIKIVGFVGN